MSVEYKSILKATSIFGGAQLIQVLVNLIKAKFVAILIGATGIGLSSMYMSSLTMIITIFGLGLNSSVVRELSKAHDDNDKEKFSIITSVFRRLIYGLSISGVICVIIIAPYLSEWAFDTTDKSVDYCFLSLVLCFTLMAQGNMAILVGARRIKDTALCTLIGSIVSLLTSIPMFYFWRLEGVVPGMIISAFANYLVTYYFIYQIRLQKTIVSNHLFWQYSKYMIKLGIAMILASLLGNVTVYLINISITRMGGLSDLGLFNAGMSITIQVITLVFSAMSADYYPRLVVSLSDKTKMNDIINQQSEIILYLSASLLSILMLLAPFIISLVLSPEFYMINNFVRILCLGMLIKAGSYALGYVSFAKGDVLVYVSLEGICTNLLNLILSIGMYYLWGLTGLAYSFLVNYILYMIVISILTKRRYHYNRSKDVKVTFLLSIISLLLLLILTYILNGLYFYIVGSFLCTLIVFYNMKKLNERANIFDILMSRIKKND